MGAPTKTEAMRAIEWWNKANKVGAAVRYRDDQGIYHDRITRSEAQLASSGIAVIFLEGVSGYVMLKRVTAIK